MNTIKRKRRRKPVWYVLVFIALVVILYFLYNTGRSATEIWRLVNMKHQEESAINEARAKLEKLKTERERLLSDSTYIEEIARRVYGMLKDGDEIFQITYPDSLKTEGNDGKEN